MTTDEALPGMETPDRPQARPRSAVASEPEEITWLDIYPQGTEAPRTGLVWAPADPVGGRGTAVWAVPDGESRPVLVLTAGRRHPVGRRSTNGRWRPRGGRVIDKGERYRETDPGARAYWPKPPTVRSKIPAVQPDADPATVTDLEAWMTMLDQLTETKEIDR